jgi:hypothetical protein
VAEKKCTHPESKLGIPIYGIPNEPHVAYRDCACGESVRVEDDDLTPNPSTP